MVFTSGSYSDFGWFDSNSRTQTSLEVTSVHGMSVWEVFCSFSSLRIELKHRAAGVNPANNKN